MSIIQILTSKFPSSLLSTFRNGWFDDSQSKLYAYSVSDARAEEFQFYVPSISGYGYVGPSTDDVRLIIPVDENSYQFKELPQLIEEGVFNWVAIEFFGVEYEGDWYCKPSFTFYEHGSIESISEKIESAFLSKSPFNGQSYFEAVPEFRDELDIEQIGKIVSDELGEPVDFYKDFGKIQLWLERNRGRKLPMRPKVQFPVYRDFVGMPWLVANEKMETKTRVNKAYEAYIYEEVVHPLARTLSRLKPEIFKEVYTLSNGGGMYNLVYPNSKKYLVGSFAYSDQDKTELVFYFVYISEEKRIYKWILPQLEKVDSFFGFLLKGELESRLPAGYELDLGDPASTLDENSFWNEYVFKKESNNYLYLKPIDIKNPQPDIYTQW